MNKADTKKLERRANILKALAHASRLVMMDESADRKTIPPAVILRLPRYLSYLREFRKKDGEKAQYLCSHEIAYALGLTTSTVR